MARREGEAAAAAAAADHKLRCPEARKRNQKLILILFGAWVLGYGALRSTI